MTLICYKLYLCVFCYNPGTKYNGKHIDNDNTYNVVVSRVGSYCFPFPDNPFRRTLLDSDIVSTAELLMRKFVSTHKTRNLSGAYYFRDSYHILKEDEVWAKPCLGSYCC